MQTSRHAIDVIKDLAEIIHARNMQTSRHAIDAIREASRATVAMQTSRHSIDAISATSRVAIDAIREAIRATAAMSRYAVAAIQETGKRREADRLARQSLL